MDTLIPTRTPAPVDAWASAHPAEFSWMEQAAARNNEFALSLLSFLTRKGYLSDGQLAAVTRSIAKAAERQTMAANAPAINIDAIEVAFNNAKKAGLKSPKLRLAGFRFSLAKSDSVNAGAVYVKKGEVYLGKIMGGKFVASYNCDAAMQSQVLELSRNPKEAAIVHGKQFGECAICGRELSDPESIKRGIGPICADKFGW